MKPNFIDEATPELWELINRQTHSAPNAAGFDINYWYGLNKDKCPNCGWVLKDLHPAANLYPHWTGACKQ
jgi:hypothetical protein